MKEIKLIYSTKSTFVDDADFDFLSKYNWYEKKYKHTSYALGVVNGKLILMHRFLLNISNEMTGDHIDANGLNNQRNNLRICTKQQNLQNKSKHFGATSNYKGISWVESRNKWVAQICVNGKQTSLGRFDNEIDAAKAYDQAARKHYGDFAKLNFPEAHLALKESETAPR